MKDSWEQEALFPTRDFISESCCLMMFSWWKSLFESSIFCSCSFFTTVGRSSRSLIEISFTSFWHRCANLAVESVSSSLLLSKARVAIITVLQLPPRLSFRIWVIMELRYGTCVSFLPLDRLWSATITCSRNESDLLIYLASFLTMLSGSVLCILSLPARSTRCSLLERIELLSLSLISIWTVKMQWERLDAWFIGVDETLRMWLPIMSRSSAVYSEVQWCTDKFLRCMFWLRSSYRVILFHFSNGISACFWSKRSKPFSL